MHVGFAFNTYWYWYVTLGCAAIVFLIIGQYLIALVWGIYKHYVGGKRALARMRNLKPGESLEPQPAVSPELPGCSAFGETEEAALEEAKIAMELWLETAEKEGRSIPKPRGKELLNMLYENITSITK